MSIERRPSQDIPAWYNMKPSGDQLFLSVHKQAVLESEEYYQRAAHRLFGDLHLPDTFILPTAEKEWGFGPIIQECQHPELNDWLVYKCRIPSLENTSSMWPNIIETTATLALIFRQLTRIEKPTDSKFPQMMEIALQVNLSGEHPISAEIRPTFLRWVNSNIGKGVEPMVAAVMIENYRRMLGNERVFDYNFFVRLIDPYDIDLQCPGNACGIYPDPNRRDKLEAYNMYSHNVDTPFQQLTLLMGMAKFDQLAMEDYLSK